MQRLDPPFPSFTLVMTEAANFDVSRLPAYRASYLERFHPYPRVSTRRPQEMLMSTVDYRYKEEAVSGESAPYARPTASYEEAHENDASTYENDFPVVGVDSNLEEMPVEERLGRSKLANTLSELLDALRSRYLTMQAVRGFLSSGQAK